MFTTSRFRHLSALSTTADGNTTNLHPITIFLILALLFLAALVIGLLAFIAHNSKTHPPGDRRNHTINAFLNGAKAIGAVMTLGIAIVFLIFALV